MIILIYVRFRCRHIWNCRRLSAYEDCWWLTDNLHKENEPAVKRRKKVQPITWSDSVGHVLRLCPSGCCSPRTGDIGKSYPYQGTPPSHFSVLCGVYAPFLGVLLGCVKRPLHTGLQQVVHSGNVLIEGCLCQNFHVGTVDAVICYANESEKDRYDK